jgi:hypothetical protein
MEIKQGIWIERAKQDYEIWRGLAGSHTFEYWQVKVPKNQVCSEFGLFQSE